MKLPETYLIEVFRPEAKHILELLTKTKDAQENKELQSYYKKLAQWGTEHLQKAGEIVLDKIKLSYKDEVIKLGLAKRTKDLWGMLNALIDLMKKHSLNEENAKVIQQTALEILAGLSKMSIPKTSEDSEDNEEEEKDPPRPDPESNSSTRRDWTAYKAKKLAKVKPASKALNEFYDEYYSQEYAGVESPEKDTRGIVDKLKSLDKILIPEFNALGYNPEVNPLAQFLKLLIEYKPDIFNRLTINTYGAVHNSFINKYITGNMLGKKFDETNILFCSDLYANKGLDIIEYLSLQDQVLKAKKNSEYVEDAYLIAKIFIQQIQPEQAEQKSNYSAQVEKLLDMQKPKQPGDDNAKLRSILEIRELYRHIFKVEAEKTKKKVDLKTVNDIVDEAEKQDVVLDMIELILAQTEYAGSAKYAEEAQMFDGWLDKRNHTHTQKSIKTSRKILLDYTLNAEALSLIIQNLVHRINEPTENKK